MLGAEDVMIKGFSVECKSREKIPKWLETFWKQTLENTQEGQAPLLQIHKLGEKHLNDFIVIRLEDFLNLLKNS